MNKRPIVFVIALGFILLNSLIWLAFAGIVGINVLPFNVSSSAIRPILAILAVIAGFTLLVLFYFLRNRNRLVYYPTLAILGGIIILTFTDEFGLADFIYLFIVLTPLVLLIVSRHWYFHQ